MPACRAVAFDFNGTLSNDEPLLARVYQEQFAELGRPITEAEYLEHLAGHTDEEMFTRWFGHADPALIEDRIDRYNRLAADGQPSTRRCGPRFVRGRARPRRHRLGGRPQRDRPVVDAAGIRDALALIVSHDDVSSGKPDPSVT